MDATHTLLTATYMYDSMCTDNFDDTLLTSHNDKSNSLAPLSACSLDCMARIHSKLEPEVKIYP